MVKLNEYGEIVEEEPPKHYAKQDQRTPKTEIPKITSEDLGIEKHTAYQRARTYIAQEIMPTVLNIKHRIQDLYKR
ncbi:MAG: hypothetical protein NT001_04665 [Candidatus Woesearchaeota archaeon]|nr:hypothetical protein [Candidatus Woesearchaeota archaeon]